MRTKNDIRFIFILFLTGLLVSINWFTWLYAVSTNNLLDSALGYYIFPILSIFLGIIFLKEKYNRNKIISVLLVVAALIYLLFKIRNFASLKNFIRTGKFTYSK